MPHILQCQPEDRYREQDQFDGQAPEFVEEPDDDLVRDEQARLLQVSANFEKFVPWGQLVGVRVHKFAPLDIQR